MGKRRWGGRKDMNRKKKKIKISLENSLVKCLLTPVHVPT
jgi:hypothetical protein